MTTNGQNDGVNVTVRSVNGGTVNFDIVETVSKDDIAGQISKQPTTIRAPPDSSKWRSGFFIFVADLRTIRLSAISETIEVGLTGYS